MIEREIKILNINPKKLIKNLLRHGAIQTWQGDITDWYFESDCMVGRTRIRQKITTQAKMKKISKKGKKNQNCIPLDCSKKKNIIITFKEKVKEAGVKARKELEVGYGSLLTAWQGLENAGMEYSWKKNKKRISFSLGEMQFDIDMYPDMPPLFEIEGPTTKSIYKRVNKLGYCESEVKTCGYQGLKKMNYGG